MFKKCLLSLLALIIAVPIFASPDLGSLSTAKTYSASGSTEGTVGTSTGFMAASAGRSVKIWRIIAQSDLSTSIVKIYDGDTTGATDNYTVVATMDLGDATTDWDSNEVPLYIAPINTQVKVGVTSTTANSLIVTWSY